MNKEIILKFQFKFNILGMCIFAVGVGMVANVKSH
jgi:hypothetical protein